MCIPRAALNGTVKVRLRFSYHLRIYTSFIMKNNEQSYLLV